MKEFAENVTAIGLRRQLLCALNDPRPFRSFKDALTSCPVERDRFQTHRRNRVWEAMRRWIQEHRVLPRSTEVSVIIYDRGICSTLPPRPVELVRSRWEEPIPEDILWSLEREDILGLGGVWGDAVSGHVDIINILGNGIATTITFRNRGTTLLHDASEETRRLHRFCCTLDGLA